MDGLGHLPVLEHLEFYDNQIRAISCIDSLVNLRVLDLSFNGIRSIPDLSHLTKLEELYVANNKLTKISGISNLRTLKKLDLGANRLRTIEGLDHLESLEQLWLGKNKITKIEGLDNLPKLRIISVQVRSSVLHYLRSCFNCDVAPNARAIGFSRSKVSRTRCT
jgi:protein phosphatase 1 regulatory subunit 7